MPRPGRWLSAAPRAARAAISVIIDTVTPVFGIVLLGWAALKLRLFDEAGARGLSLFAFNFAIPVMLLRSLASAELPGHPEWGLVLAYFGCAAVIFFLGVAMGFGPFGRRGADPAIFGITAAFSNVVVLGTPLVITAYGPPAAVPVALIIAFHSPFLFTLTTIVAETGKGATGALHLLPWNIAKGLVTNPILWGIFGGLALNMADLPLPPVLDRLAGSLGAAALPAALFALGANLARFHLAKALRPALALTGLKTLLHPLLLWAVLPLFDMSAASAAVAITVAALPAGINSYLFAARYEAALPEATSTILLSTAVSVVTLSVLLATLRP
ncbi:MAG: AEC family transporter [Geminicoccaceae bacterium]